MLGQNVSIDSCTGQSWCSRSREFLLAWSHHHHHHLYIPLCIQWQWHFVGQQVGRGRAAARQCKVERRGIVHPTSLGQVGLRLQFSDPVQQGGHGPAVVCQLGVASAAAASRRASFSCPASTISIHFSIRVFFPAASSPLQSFPRV